MGSYHIHRGMLKRLYILSGDLLNICDYTKTYVCLYIYLSPSLSLIQKFHAEDNGMFGTIPIDCSTHARTDLGVRTFVYY